MPFPLVSPLFLLPACPFLLRASGPSAQRTVLLAVLAVLAVLADWLVSCLADWLVSGIAGWLLSLLLLILNFLILNSHLPLTFSL